MATIQEVLKEKGFPYKDNRSIDFRSINKSIDNGVLILVSDKGYLSKSKSGFKFNLEIRYNNYVQRFYIKNMSSLDASCIGWQILNCTSKFIISLKTDVLIKDDCTEKCGKCKGTGRIPQFMWYAEGLCFDCMGVGHNSQAKAFNTL